MPRVAPESRFEDLIDAATKVFIENGYQRTQMSDVAEAMGRTPNAVRVLYCRALRALRDEVPELA